MASQLKVYVGLAQTLAPAGTCKARTARCSNSEDEAGCMEANTIDSLIWKHIAVWAQNCKLNMFNYVCFATYEAHVFIQGTNSSID